MKEDKIHIQTLSLMGDKQTITDGCLLRKECACSIKGFKCMYGVTEIKVPKECPLVGSVVAILVSLKK